MKVQITVDEKPVNGYVYVNPNMGHQLDLSTCGASDNECVEILAPHILDYLPISHMQPLVQMWIKKLRKGGKLILGGTDLYEICKNVMNGNANTVQANLLLYGNQESNWNMKRGQINLKDLVDLMNESGLKVMKKRLDGVEMCVEAVRD